MFKNYLLTTVRSLGKNKLFVLVNVLSIGVAVALCITGYLNWKFRNDWDKHEVNAETLYRVEFSHQRNDGEDYYAFSPQPLAAHINNSLADVAASRFVISYTNLKIDHEVFAPSIIYTDSSFAGLFTLPMKCGSLRKVNDPSSIFISDKLALKYFKREDVVGEQVTQIIGDEQRVLTIEGVFDERPRNASLRFDAASAWNNMLPPSSSASVQHTNWKDWCTTFLLVKKKTLLPMATKLINQYVELQNKEKPDLKVRQFYLRPFDGIEDVRNVKGSNLWNGAPKAIVTISSIMAGLMLLVACFNFMNTSLSLASQRLKEISIRKVIGGRRVQLVIQFLTENLLICLLGFIAGLLLAEVIVPAYDDLWFWLDLDLNYVENAEILLFLLGLLLFTGLLAGSYPALYVTSFSPVCVLKGEAKLTNTSLLTRVLLSSQFTASVLAIIFSVAFYRNAQYQEDFNLGFSSENLISLWIPAKSFETYRNALSESSDIASIAGTRSHVGNGFYSSQVKSESVELQSDVLDVGADYVATAGIELLVGRDFHKNNTNDIQQSVLVSEEFVKKMGWTDDPIGKSIIWKDTVQLYVIGVVRDVYLRTLFGKIEPVMIRCVAESDYQQIVIRYNPGSTGAVDALLKKLWQQHFPNLSYEPQFIENTMSNTNTTNKNATVVFAFLGSFAALMALTGLFNLVSLTVLRRTKEIGIRKILGASPIAVVQIITRQFLFILLTASLLAASIAFFVVDNVLEIAWAYYQAVSIITIVPSVVIVILFASLTVVSKTLSAANMNPVRALRSE